MYLNGVEVARANMPGAPAVITASTLSSSKIVAASYANASVFNVSLSSAVNGANRVAVEVSVECSVVGCISLAECGPVSAGLGVGHM